MTICYSIQFPLSSLATTRTNNVAFAPLKALLSLLSSNRFLFFSAQKSIILIFTFVLHMKVLTIVICIICSFIFTPMTKKSSKKTPSQVQDTTVVEEQKPSPAQKKQGSEIDEIFAGKKRKKSKVEKTEKPEDLTKRPKKTKKNTKKKAKGSDGGSFADAPSRPKKRTQDGLAIYTEDELGINRADAGSTPLCPFDCSCCF